MKREELLQTVRTGNIVPFAPSIVKADGRALGNFFEYNGERLSSNPFLSGLVDSARRHISRIRPHEFKNEQGKFSLEGEASQTFQKIGRVMGGILVSSDTLRIPETNEERDALVKILAESSLVHNGKVDVVIPVCPDYSSDRQTIGSGLSREAQAGVAASKRLLEIFSFSNFSPTIRLLVANTEDDIPEIIAKSAQNNKNFYQAQCRNSVDAIASEFAQDKRVSVQTFTDYLGEGFRQKQYMYEDTIKRKMKDDTKVREEVVKIGEERKKRHGAILGREEREYELTIRYIAQYAALGEIIGVRENTIAVNYDTPNKKYYNIQNNLLKGARRERSTIPVIGSIKKL